MLEAFRKYIDSLTGITELSRERAERIVGDLAKRGEVTTKNLQKVAQDLVERSTRNRQELVRLVQKEIKRQVGALGLATQDDVDKVAKRVKELERKNKPARASASSSRTTTARRTTPR